MSKGEYTSKTAGEPAKSANAANMPLEKFDTFNQLNVRTQSGSQ